jgi:hypothetical protein
MTSYPALIVGNILRGPRPAERMRFELFGRLAAQVEVDYSEVVQAAAIDRDGISTLVGKCSLY